MEWKPTTSNPLWKTKKSRRAGKMSGPIKSGTLGPAAGGTTSPGRGGGDMAVGKSLTRVSGASTSCLKSFPTSSASLHGLRLGRDGAQCAAC